MPNLIRPACPGRTAGGGYCPNRKGACPEHPVKPFVNARSISGNAYGPEWRVLSARLRRERGACEDCGSTADLTVDHIIEVSQGGSLLDEANCRVRCRRCHARKSGAFAGRRRR